MVADKQALYDQLPRIRSRHERIVERRAKGWEPIDSRVTTQEQHITVLLAILDLQEKRIKRLNKKLKAAEARANLMADECVKMSFRVNGIELPPELK
jgi:hypothetical protein